MQTNRRDLLKASIAFTMLSSMPSPLRAMGQKVLAYVGTYNSPVDGGGNGKGIYLFEMNPATGELTLVDLAAAAPNASWLSFDPSGRFLYAANEVANFGGNSGSVSAYAVDRQSGKSETTQRTQLRRSRTGSPERRPFREICFRRQLRRRKHGGAAHPPDRSARPSHVCSSGYRLGWPHHSVKRSRRQLCFQRS